MEFLQPGMYLTEDGKEVRIDQVNPDHHSVLATVKGVGFVAYDFDGKVAYDHVPQALNIRLDTWQPKS